MLLPAISAASIDSIPTAGINGFYLLKLVLALLLVLAVFLFLARILRQMNGYRDGAAGSLAVLAGLSIGAREKIIIIKAGDKQMLLGISPAGIVKLDEFDTPVVVEPQSDDKSFKAQLSEFTRGRQK